MAIEIVTWKIRGFKPLIQSNPHSMWAVPEEEDGRVKKTRKKAGMVGSDSENFLKAKSQLYLNEEGQPYHPAIGFYDNLLLACKGRGFGKGGKVPALTIIPQAVALLDENFDLYDPDTLDGEQPKRLTSTGWHVDFRRVINWNLKPEKGGTCTVAIRPLWKRWGGFLSLAVDDTFFEFKEEEDEKGEKTKVPDYSGITDLLNVSGHYFGMGVGRRHILAMVKGQPKWSGFGMGKFSAELK